MTPAARLIATLDLFTAVEADTRPVDAVMSFWFRSRRDLGEFDRGDVIEWLYSLLRHRARLLWWLEKLGAEPSPRAQFLAWLALVNRKAPDEVARMFQAAKTAPALSSDEEKFLTKLQTRTIEHPDMPEAVRLECPAWAEASLRARFGARFGAELAAMLVPPPVDLRVNPVKSSRKAILRALGDLGLKAEKTPLAPLGVRVAERFSYARLQALKSGEVEIQDEGSQLVALLVDAQPGERVVDFCAGAGGKTLAMAAQMENKGRVIACDVNEGRLKRCAERLKTAGLHNAETKLLASETDRWVKRHKMGFDRVLIDAPCSGTGTWRRNPDTRWRGAETEGLADLVALQKRILASAARLVKPGGRLVYATCSLLPEENEAQVGAFLATTPGFRLVPLAEVAPELAAKLGGETLSLTPARHNTDGFFAAVLTRETV